MNLLCFQVCDFVKYKNMIIPPACVQLEKGAVKYIKPLANDEWEPLIILGMCGNCDKRFWWRWKICLVYEGSASCNDNYLLKKMHDMDIWIIIFWNKCMILISELSISKINAQYWYLNYLLEWMHDIYIWIISWNKCMGINIWIIS